ncbi:MAG: hypothetical protein WC804_11050 [Sphingomonas sp.]|jgi:hypothetical protein
MIDRRTVIASGDGVPDARADTPCTNPCDADSLPAAPFRLTLRWRA